MQGTSCISSAFANVANSEGRMGVPRFLLGVVAGIVVMLICSLPGTVCALWDSSVPCGEVSAEDWRCGHSICPHPGLPLRHT